MAPSLVVEWLRRTYPKPTVDPQWLDACLAWISEELQLSDPTTHGDEIISNVDIQLLNSDLSNSTLAGTGFPDSIFTAENTLLKGSFLVQIQGITDIGHSAFTLRNVQQMRQDDGDSSGLVGRDEDDEGPIAKYPRGMLRFDLSDGTKSLRAIEYRRMPELELGVTPLGFKMVLRDVPIRRGIAFLEPSNVILKGHMTEELDINREANFVRSLHMRLGQPEPEQNVQAQPADPRGSPHDGRSVANDHPRPPLREVTEENPTHHQPLQLPREELEPPTRRRVPTGSSFTSTSEPTAITSPYFTDTTSTSATSSNLTDVRLSPVRRKPLPPNLLDQGQLQNENYDFSDDTPMDDAFFQELDAAEQAAINITQSGDETGEQTLRPARGTNAIERPEVIVIDSDEDDKENLAPVSQQRRVRRRTEASDVIVIE